LSIFFYYKFSKKHIISMGLFSWILGGGDEGTDAILAQAGDAEGGGGRELGARIGPVLAPLRDALADRFGRAGPAPAIDEAWAMTDAETLASVAACEVPEVAQLRFSVSPSRMSELRFWQCFHAAAAALRAGEIEDSSLRAGRPFFCLLLFSCHPPSHFYFSFCFFFTFLNHAPSPAPAVLDAIERGLARVGTCSGPRDGSEEMRPMPPAADSPRASGDIVLPSPRGEEIPIPARGAPRSRDPSVPAGAPAAPAAPAAAPAAPAASGLSAKERLAQRVLAMKQAQAAKAAGGAGSPAPHVQQPPAATQQLARAPSAMHAPPLYAADASDDPFSAAGPDAGAAQAGDGHPPGADIADMTV
jgi:hypothetical protein